MSTNSRSESPDRRDHIHHRISGRGQTPPCLAVFGLARNLDWRRILWSECGQRAVENALVHTRRSHEEVLHRILGELSDNKIDLLLVHVAEGVLRISNPVLNSALERRRFAGSHMQSSMGGTGT